MASSLGGEKRRVRDGVEIEETWPPMRSLRFTLCVMALVAGMGMPAVAPADPGGIRDLSPTSLQRRLTAVVDHAARCTVRIDTDDGMGSGTILTSDGLILTSAHVIEGADDVVVTLTDGRRFPGSILGINGQGDIALVRISATGLPHATLDERDAVAPGQWVVAVGHPVSAFDDFQPTVSAGVVRRVDGVIRAGEDKVFRNAIVSDVPLSPGSSGGGLWDLDGHLAGLNAAVTRNERGAFSVRVAEYLADADRLRRGERFDRKAASSGDEADDVGRSTDRRSYFKNNLGYLESRLAARTVTLRDDTSTLGRGVIVSRRGEVLTPSGLAAGELPGFRVAARLSDGRVVAARLVAVDRTNDVALWMLPEDDCGDYPFFRLDSAVTPPRGALALQGSGGRGGMKGGIVGAPQRTPPLVMTGEVYYPNVVQVDLRLYRQDLGSPVMDIDGRLIGMVVQHRLRRSESAWSREPFGAFLLPPSVLMESYRLLHEGRGRGERPVGFLGVGLEDLTVFEKQRLGVQRGVAVALADRRFPAYRAGIRSRDVILEIDGKPVGSRGQAIQVITGLHRGEHVPIVVQRRGRRVTFDVEIADRKDI